MAFATKYKVTFKDYESVTWEIEFQEDGFGGSVTNLTPGADPLSITYHDNDKFQTIVGSGADIQIKYESAVDSLYSDSETSQAIKVVIDRATVLFWQGFVLPGQFHREFNDPVNFVSITASDQLGSLKDIKFENSGDPYYYLDKEIEVITNILAKTGMTNWVYDAVNIFESTYNVTAADSSLDQTYIHQEKYWNDQTDERDNCHNVLEDILKKYGAHIRQSGGNWYILRPNAFTQGSVAWRSYSAGGTYASNGTWTPYNTIGTSMFYMYSDAELTKIQGVGRCEVTQNPPRRANVLKNGSFDSFTWTGSAFRYWADHGSLSYSNDSNQLKVASGTKGTDWIEATLVLWNPTSIRLHFDVTPTFTGTPATSTLDMEIVIGTDYLTNASGAGAWSSGSGVWFVDGKDIGTGNTEHISIDFPAMTEQSYTFPNATTLEIRIYPYVTDTVDSSNYCHVDNMVLEVGSDTPETYVHSHDNSTTIYSTKYVEIGLGDMWMDELTGTTAQEDGFWWTMASSSETDETDVWYIKGDKTTAATPVPIGEILAKQTVEAYVRSIDSIRGTIRSTNIDISRLAMRDANFTDSNGFKKSYWPVGVSLDARKNEWYGQWIELPLTQTDQGTDWSTETYSSAVISDNEVTIDETVSGTPTCTSQSYTAVAGETVRVKVTVVDNGSTDPPNYEIDSQTGTLAIGTNYLEFVMSSAGAKTFEINHTNGETADCIVTFYIYSIKGI